MKEIWKDIEGWEGYYQVSNLGRVKSLHRIVAHPISDKRIKERILKPSPDGSGYLMVNLNRDGRKKPMKIHKLVSIAFLSHVANGHKIVIDHINNNKRDNRLENLQLISTRENTSKDRFRGKYSSKYIGVSWNKTLKKWGAFIGINGKVKNLGVFNSEFEAHQAYKKALNLIN